jgi:hypothetical protein
MLQGVGGASQHHCQPDKDSNPLQPAERKEVLSHKLPSDVRKGAAVTAAPTATGHGRRLRKRKELSGDNNDDGVAHGNVLLFL